MSVAPLEERTFRSERGAGLHSDIKDSLSRRVMVHEMTHEKRRDARDLFPEGICDDFEGERVCLGLDAFVYEDEQRVTCISR